VGEVSCGGEDPPGEAESGVSLSVPIKGIPLPEDDLAIPDPDLDAVTVVIVPRGELKTAQLAAGRGRAAR
jgi:hypothetical protein